jgi:hypothetical protein
MEQPLVEGRPFGVRARRQAHTAHHVAQRYVHTAHHVASAVRPHRTSRCFSGTSTRTTRRGVRHCRCHSCRCVSVKPGTHRRQAGAHGDGRHPGVGLAGQVCQAGSAVIDLQAAPFRAIKSHTGSGGTADAFVTSADEPGINADTLTPGHLSVQQTTVPNSRTGRRRGVLTRQGTSTVTARQRDPPQRCEPAGQGDRADRGSERRGLRATERHSRGLTCVFVGGGGPI